MTENSANRTFIKPDLTSDHGLARHAEDHRRSFVIIGATLALGSLWIPYAEPLWRIVALGTMVVLSIRIRERKESQRSGLLMIAVLAFFVPLGSPAFGNT